MSPNRQLLLLHGPFSCQSGVRPMQGSLRCLVGASEPIEPMLMSVTALAGESCKQQLATVSNALTPGFAKQVQTAALLNHLKSNIIHRVVRGSRHCTEKAVAMLLSGAKYLGADAGAAGLLHLLAAAEEGVHDQGAGHLLLVEEALHQTLQPNELETVILMVGNFANEGLAASTPMDRLEHQEERNRLCYQASVPEGHEVRIGMCFSARQTWRSAAADTAPACEACPVPTTSSLQMLSACRSLGCPCQCVACQRRGDSNTANLQHVADWLSAWLMLHTLRHLLLA